MLGNRAVWRRLSAVSAVRSDLFNAFLDLRGGYLLMSEAPTTFFWALCLVLAIGAAAFDSWCRGGQTEFAAHCEEDEDEVLSGGSLGSLCLGRSNGYSSLEPWLIRLPTRCFVAPPLRPARGSRRHTVRPSPPVRFKASVDDPRGPQPSEDPWDARLLGARL